MNSSLGPANRRPFAVAIMVPFVLTGLTGCPPPGPVPPPVPPVTSTPPVPPTSPVQTSPSGDTIVMTQDGIVQAPLDREESLGVADLDETLGGVGFAALQTDTCGLAIWSDLGFAATYDADTTVVLAIVLERDDVVSSAGVRIGDTLNDVVAAHGEGALTRVGSATTPLGGDLIVVDDQRGGEPSDTSRHLAYELDAQNQVARIRAGRMPEVAAPAYCGDVAPRPEETGWPVDGTRSGR